MFVQCEYLSKEASNPNIWPSPTCACSRFLKTELGFIGRFPFTKKIGKFLLGISVWGERVPFVTSSIRGKGGLAAQKTAKGVELVIKTRNLYVTGTQISIGKFPPGKRDYLFRNFVYSGKFPVARTKKSCSIYIPIGISGFFWKMENSHYDLQKKILSVCRINN